MPRKAHGTSNKYADQKNESGSGGSAGQKWWTVHRTTTHNDAMTPKAVVHFDDDVDKCFTF